MFNRLTLIIAIVVLAVAVAVTLTFLPRSLRSDGAAETPYNVLLITLDTTRADRLGCYGYGRGTSPNLDALAADAALFEQAISTSAVTPMSHASIFTGLNPYQHGLRVFYGPTGHYLEPSFPTLASVLKSNGWATGAFISAYPASERFGLHHGFDTFESDVAESIMAQELKKPFPLDAFFLRQRTADSQRRADATTDQVLEWLDAAERPFMLWTHYFDPHDAALVPPAEITEKFGAFPSDRRAVATVYDPEIFFMDMHLGRLIELLKQTGEYERTVIVVVADHGQGLGQHGWFPHRLLYQEQIRLPLIVRTPGGPRGLRVPTLVRSIDVMPTIVEAVGLTPPTPIEGASLLGLMNSLEEPPRVAFAEALNTIDVHAPKQLPPHQKDDLFCLVEMPWKLIYHKHQPDNSELYNLEKDPAELRNIARRQPEIVAQMLAKLEELGAMDVQIIEPDQPMDPESLEKLRSLGYVGDDD